MADHARLSPSSCDRWMSCPGSVALSEQFPDTASQFAAEGTFAHSIREKCLKEGKDAVDFIGTTGVVEDWTFEVDVDMARFLQTGIEWVREQSGQFFVEQRVDMQAWITDCWGTSDTTIASGSLLTVLDLKYGRGVTVGAEENRQLMLYALGAWAALDDDLRRSVQTVRLVIDQPRGQGGTWMEWECSISHILNFAEEAAAAAKLTEDPDAPLSVTPKGCQFCPVGSHAACPEQHRFFAEMLGIGKEEIALPAIDQLTPERRSFIIEHASLVKKWLESIHILQLDHAIKGLPTPGFKAVSTLGDRSWTNAETAEEFWKTKMAAKEIYNQKLKSPAQMEKVAGTRNWKAAQELITRPEGKPALVPLSDPREPLVPLLGLLDDLDDDLI